MSQKVNIKAWLEFELAYCDVAVQNINLYVKRLFQMKKKKKHEKVSLKIMIMVLKLLRPFFSDLDISDVSDV